MTGELPGADRMDPNRLYSLAETGAVLRCSVRKIRRLIGAGDLIAIDSAPSNAARRTLLVTGQSLADFLARRLSARVVKPCQKRPLRPRSIEKSDKRGRLTRTEETP